MNIDSVHNDMKFTEIYKLSNKFAPPSVDLRQGEIMDDYGDESYADLPVSHKLPDDVRKPELRKYQNAYTYMNPEDLIFYLYSIVSEFIKDNTLEIHPYLYSAERSISYFFEILTPEDMEILKKAFQELYISDADLFYPEDQFPEILKLIGRV